MSTRLDLADPYEAINTIGYISAADIPRETDELVVIQALSEQLDEPIGTIVVKSVFDTTFPARLKGIIDSDSFKTTVEVINWFLELRLYAETEKHSRTFELSQTWRRLHAKYTIDRRRQALIKQYCVDNRLVCPFFRDFTFTQEEFDEVERKLLEALHMFIDDENRNYIPKGWYWTYPENHGWLWMEFRKMSTDQHPQGSKSVKSSEIGVRVGGSGVNQGQKKSEAPTSVGSSMTTSSSSSVTDSALLYQSLLKGRLAATLPNMPVPPTPEWGIDIKITVLHHFKVDKHTEYLLFVDTDMGKWTPTTTTYALKRYTDFETFYEQMQAYIRLHAFECTLPPLPEKSILNSKTLIAKRIDAFQTIFTRIAADPNLFAAPPLFKFFNIHPCPVAWRGLPYIKRSFLEIYH